MDDPSRCRPTDLGLVFKSGFAGNRLRRNKVD